MKKLIAIILTLVLAFSMSVTALAGPEATSEAEAITGTGTTEVSLIVDGTQVSATVPLEVTLAVSPAGVVTGPTNYTITNTSVMPIRVSNVTITPKTGFTTGTEGNDTKIGAITLAEGTGGSDVALSAWSVAKNAAAWDMATGGMITLGFGGSVTGVTQNITRATEAFSIVFTIVAGAHTA